MIFTILVSKRSHEGTKAPRKNDIYLKTLCLGLRRAQSSCALVAKNGFTLPELLTAIAIIVILIGVLMPALAQVKKLAKETKQKAQIAGIEMGVILYKNDFGDYPPSHGSNDLVGHYAGYYCGSQTLAEAMFGQDLLGFHPDSVYRADGWSKDGTTIADDLYPDPFDPVDNLKHKKNLDSRKDAYLDRTNIGVFKLEDIYITPPSPPLALCPGRFVICDVFTAVSRKIKIGGMEKTYKVGTPVLYFRANPSAENPQLIPHDDPIELAKNIYNSRDNYFLMALKRISDGKEHPLCPYDTDVTKAKSGECFYGYIGDPMIPNLTRPLRPDSFLLISAGNDGLYGTKDDICNFDPNLPS